MDNLKIYNQARAVPENAKKSIGAGRLKGMTDVNPMWRIKQLTELFGPAGVGWWYTIEEKRIIEDEITNQKAAFVDILLYYVDPETGRESHGIPGTGGASFVSQERNGPYLSDECFKMALTDAISVASKALGLAADVYWGADRTKYSEKPEGLTPQSGLRPASSPSRGAPGAEESRERGTYGGKTVPPRKRLIAKLAELGIDPNEYAKSHNLSGTTAPEEFERLLKELERHG